MPSAFLLRDARHATHDIFFCASHVSYNRKKFFLYINHTIFRSTEYAYFLQKHTRKCTLYV